MGYMTDVRRRTLNEKQRATFCCALSNGSFTLVRICRRRFFLLPAGQFVARPGNILSPVWTSHNYSICQKAAKCLLKLKPKRNYCFTSARALYELSFCMHGGDTSSRKLYKKLVFVDLYEFLAPNSMQPHFAQNLHARDQNCVV